MKILVIPSWFPTKENPVSGSFIAEQVELLSDNQSMTVMLGQIQNFGRKHILKFIIELIRWRHSLKLSYEKNYQVVNFKIPQIHFGPNWMREFFFNRAIFSAYKETKTTFDLIHLHSFSPFGMSSVKLSRELNIPLIFTEHLPLKFGNVKGKKLNELKQVMNGSQMILSVSNHLRKQLSEISAEKDIHVVGNLVDEVKFKFLDFVERQKNKDTNQLNILWVGSLYKRKDPLTFIRSLNRMEKFDGIRATMVFQSNQGEIDLNELKKEIHEKRDANIQFKFAMNREEIQQLYYSHDVYVSTSIDETFGLTIAEARSCGMYILCCENGGSREFLKEDDNVSFFKIGDVGFLQSSLEELDEKIGDLKSVPDESLIREFGREGFASKMNSIYDLTCNLARESK